MISTIQKIYSHLGDQLSKEYFKSRLLYSLTGDYAEICKMVAHTYPGTAIREKIKAFPDALPFIWGAGFCGTMIKRGFPDINWRGFIDSNPVEQMKQGIPVLSPEKFMELSEDTIIVVSSTDWHGEIIQQLKNMDYPMERVINAGKMILDLENCQYFDLPHLWHSGHETFIDAGCFDGSSVKNFIKWSNDAYDEIYSFEPDEKCYEISMKELKDVGNLYLLKQGLWSNEGMLSFSATGDSMSQITEEGATRIAAVRLDRVIGAGRPTFIKMDIEGAEKEALAGAARTIRDNSPKLAISIYHKPEDIWEIPEMILNMNPEYRLYIRHYTLRDAETVLYAV